MRQLLRGLRELRGLRPMGPLSPLGLLRLLRLRRPSALSGPIGPSSPSGLISLISLFALFALITLAGCSSESTGGVIDEPVPQEPTQPETGTAIVFAAGEQQEATVTRAATSLHDKGVDKFTVWGYKNMSYSEETVNDTKTIIYGDPQNVFPGYVVKWEDNSATSTTTNSDGWEYVRHKSASNPEQGIKYWDWSARAYRFFGVAAGVNGAEPTGITEITETNGANEPTGTIKACELTITTDVAPVYYTGEDNKKYIDLTATATKLDALPYFTTLWFSTGNSIDYPDREFGKPVQLGFLKPYSKVRFGFKYVYPREATELTNISFKPSDGTAIARKGTLKITYPLVGKGTKEEYDGTGVTDNTLAAFTEDYDFEDDTKPYPLTGDGWYIVFPNNSQYTYTLSVEVNGAGKAAVVPKEYMQWLPGYSYTYIFKITEEGGVEIDMVEAAFTPWQAEITGSHTVYNW